MHIVKSLFIKKWYATVFFSNLIIFWKSRTKTQTKTVSKIIILIAHINARNGSKNVSLVLENDF